MRETELPENGEKAQAGRSYRRLMPLAILVAGLVAFFALGLDRYLTFSALERHREYLTTMANQHAVLAPLVYTAIYAVTVALSIPGGAILTILGGFLFGLVGGTAYSVIGATIGAAGVFLAARTALHDPLQRRAGSSLKAMKAGFNENALSYLLFLRLVPVFPFWLVNLVPALLGVQLSTFMLGTFFGIIPGTLVYASVGNGLGAIIDAGEKPDLGVIFMPEVLLPILGLSVLSLVPVVYKKVKARRGDAGGT